MTFSLFFNKNLTSTYSPKYIHIKLTLIYIKNNYIFIGKILKLIYTYNK